MFIICIYIIYILQANNGWPSKPPNMTLSHLEAGDIQYRLHIQYTPISTRANHRKTAGRNRKCQVPASISSCKVTTLVAFSGLSTGQCCLGHAHCGDVWLLQQISWVIPVYSWTWCIIKIAIDRICSKKSGKNLEPWIMFPYWHPKISDSQFSTPGMSSSTPQGTRHLPVSQGQLLELGGFQVPVPVREQLLGVPAPTPVGPVCSVC